ncbi:MAG TPA: hypothetical protein VLE43_15765, partial [Candidatus Saccharimonadia bacterium]|nr:hypothetical protein [Candidatus Saccharimonadia bacterium]
KQLSNVKRVRMLPRPAGEKEEEQLLRKLKENAPLKADLAKMAGVVDVSEELFRPVLRLAADYANYGDGSACWLQPGAIILIGDDEPDFILYFCFKCHDVVVVRRPNKESPEVFARNYRTSPELEGAVFELAKKMFPGDAGLQKFPLKQRIRSTHPPKRVEEKGS